LSGHDVAIDFSIGDAVIKNVEACALAHVPLVEGATGWKQHESTAKQLMTEHFRRDGLRRELFDRCQSFYRIAKQAAALFSAVDGYAPFIEEAHHNRKRDAPSGTALKLRDIMSEHLGPDIPTSSTRAGYIPGTHRIGFDSEGRSDLVNAHSALAPGFRKRRAAGSALDRRTNRRI
jgi:4-hydroxy-tetrahydrodipicolinate reductase